MRHISRLTLGLSALAFAFGASGPARALDEATKPKTEESAEQKRDESKDSKREDKAETREDKAGAKNEKKAKAARGDKSAEKSTDKKKNRADNAAYLRKLGQLIRARSPGATNLGEGSAVVRFRLGASGAPNSVAVVSASTPRHGQLARSIVSGMRAPPPPGGSYDGVQNFRFH
ncbi:MAG: hypothetical protein AB7F41_07460 [Methylocystis sp.]|uniref:hypothetical protein n=1 Tax=Methylocystis sp. TaxID=1911079 RepID=UPI003D0D9E11